MSTNAGYLGNIVWYDSSGNQYTLNAYQWNITYEAGEGETTDWTQIAALAGAPKTWIPLTTEWSGSFNCRLDSATAVPDMDSTLTTLRLFNTYVAGVTEFGYRGEAFVTADNITNDANGMPEIVFNFRGSGVLTIGNIAGALAATGALAPHTAANGAYNYLGAYNAHLQFKHATENYWLYYSATVGNYWVVDTAVGGGPGDETNFWETGADQASYIDTYDVLNGTAAGDIVIAWE